MNPMDYLRRDYQIKEELGKGTYGQVFKVKNRITREVFAAKYIKNFMESEIQAKMVVREITFLRKLSQIKYNIFTTNLRDIIIAGEPETFDSIFLVMDYESNDQQKLMDTKGLLFDEEHSLIVLYNLLSALRLIHSSNVMHRDLKPNNVLINHQCQVKICDFGLARTFQEDLDESPKLIKNLSRQVMTRWYRAPEVILQQQYNEKVDIWSAGCIFAELLKFSNQYNQQEDKELFKGNSCFPISPRRMCKKQQTQACLIEKEDQMVKILSVVEGNSDIFSQKSCGIYLNQVQELIENKQSIESIFYKSSSEVHYLMKNMLDFDPTKRMSAENLLKNPIFDNFRNPEQERNAPFKIYLKVDWEDDSDYRQLILQNILKLKFG